MKKFFSLLILCLLPFAIAAAATFNLKVEVSPDGAGSLNTSGGVYEEGQSVTLRAYANTSFQFLGWYEGEALLSSATSFNFTMPARDAVVTAKYEFDPAVPADPDSMGTNYTVTVSCKPEGSGSFNKDQFTLAEGDSVRVYAYANAGFNFRYWENEQGAKISDEQNFYYVMPHGNQHIYGVFEYDPQTPANPAKNYWNAETGELIIDDFTPGYLSNAASDAIGNSSRQAVTIIIVSGEITTNDLGIVNTYSNCALLDLKRTTGITEIPSYAFDNTQLETVILPATIESIGNRAFYGCAQLLSLTCYAPTPPSLGTDVFAKTPEGLIVYVPAAAVGLYQDADGWSNCTILPLQESVHSITVNLPEGTAVADYANMWIELANASNGQHVRQLVNNQLSYKFNNVLDDTKWSISLKNQYDDVFGRIDDIEMKGQDVVVSFSSLLKPRRVALSVQTPDGRIVTGQTQIVWYSGTGDYLVENAYAGLFPTGKELRYDVILRDSLGTHYRELYAQPYVVADNPQSSAITLQPIPKVKVSGRVSSDFGLIGGASVMLAQWANGRYSTVKTAQTASNGYFEIEALNDTTKLVVTYSGYRPVTLNKKDLSGGADLGTLRMERVSGTVVTANVRMKSASSEQAQLAPLTNISFSLLNKTTGKTVEDFVVQDRQIVVPTEAKPGDQLELTATDLIGSYLSASAVCTIAKNDSATVELTMTELGSIESAFEASPNAENVLYLYDGSGALVAHANYAGKSATFAHLQAGAYTLLAMGKSLLRGNLLHLSDVGGLGMVEGRDYLQASVTVENGIVASVAFNIIPLVNESLFGYIREDSYFQVNKLSVAAGQYVTLSSRIYFKEEYEGKVSNIKLIVNIPDACEMVDNSLMVGTTPLPYTLDNHRITLTLSPEECNERVRFCVVPTMGGTHRLSAYAQFDYNGQRMQSVGDAYFETSSLSLVVPASTSSTQVLITGKATRSSTVEVYDNGALIGQTETLLNGDWRIACQLADAYNLSTHRIFARVYGQNGITLQTETQTVNYDKDAVEAKTVFMTFFNPYMNRNVDVTFDLQKGTNSASSYSFNKTTPFTFIADLTNNDPTVVNEVYIHVFTSDENVSTLQADYDEKLQRWVAVQEFTAKNLPVNVSVTVNYTSPMEYDKAYAAKKTANMEQDISEFRRQSGSVEALYAELNEELAKEVPDRSSIQTIVESIIDQENNLYGFADTAPDADFILKVNQATTDAEIADLLNELTKSSISDDSQPRNDFEMPSVDMANGVKSPVVRIHSSSPISGEQDFLTIFQNAYANGYTDSWETKEEVTGVFTLSNSMGLTITLDFREVVDIPEGSLDDVATKDKYTDALSAYFDQLSTVDNNANSQQIDNGLCLLISNYHYALRALYSNSIAQSRTQEFRRISFKGAIEGLIGRGFEYFMDNKFPDFDELLEDNLDILKDEGEWSHTINEIRYHCPNGWQKNDLFDEAQKIRSDQRFDNIKNLLSGMALDAVSACGGSYMFAGLTGVTVGVVSWPVVAAGAMIMAASWGVKKYYEKENKKKRQGYEFDMNDIRRRLTQECCPNKECGGPVVPPPPSPIYPTVPILDPSGYVYEAVSSNRLQGVTATVFQKVQEEDMYGDLHDAIVKWEAEPFGQINPQITDKDGNYAWDVPQGLWQVKFEKEGYETTYSDWLPVPPPQLDVNIPMHQNVQPQVKWARAFEDAVELEFDKYMMPAELNTGNIQVMEGGATVSGSVQLLNEEASYGDSQETFASKLRFNADAPFKEKEVTLVVTSRVKSYTGMNMLADYQQVLPVEREVKQIVCDSAVTVGYGQQAVVVVEVLPAAASAGKTLLVNSSSAMIVRTAYQTAVINADGQAEIAVTGELPGSAALRFTVEGYELSAQTVVAVENVAVGTVATPTASIPTGTTVDKGTLLTLACETEGATIYYTTDGSCPCDESGSRKVFDGTAIRIDTTMVVKAMATAAGMYDSDVAEFVYTVKAKDGIETVAAEGGVELWPLPVRHQLNVSAGGKTIKSVAVSSLNGVKVASSNEVAKTVTIDLSHIPAGVYIANVLTSDGILSRKLLKVE